MSKPDLSRSVTIRFLMGSLKRLLAAAGIAALIVAWPGPARVSGVAQDADAALTLRVIVVSSAEAAQGVVDRLANGESFAVVAKAVSTAPNADEGGWLGKQRVLELRPE